MLEEWDNPDSLYLLREGYPHMAFEYRIHRRNDGRIILLGFSKCILDDYYSNLIQEALPHD